MRLSEEQRQAIRDSVLAEDPSAAVYLFGSRTDDSRRGGDIDLYVETDREADLLLYKARVLSRLWERMGPQRIDLIVHARGRPLNPIEAAARGSGIRL